MNEGDVGTVSFCSGSRWRGADAGRLPPGVREAAPTWWTSRDGLPGGMGPTGGTRHAWPTPREAQSPMGGWDEVGPGGTGRSGGGGWLAPGKGPSTPPQSSAAPPLPRTASASRPQAPMEATVFCRNLAAAWSIRSCGGPPDKTADCGALADDGLATIHAGHASAKCRGCATSQGGSPASTADENALPGSNPCPPIWLRGAHRCHAEAGSVGRLLADEGQPSSSNANGSANVTAGPWQSRGVCVPCGEVT